MLRVVYVDQMLGRTQDLLKVRLKNATMACRCFDAENRKISRRNYILVSTTAGRGEENGTFLSRYIVLENFQATFFACFYSRSKTTSRLNLSFRTPVGARSGGADNLDNSSHSISGAGSAPKMPLRIRTAMLGAVAAGRLTPAGGNCCRLLVY